MFDVQRSMFNHPIQFLSGPLLLRALTPEDAPALLAFFDSHDEETIRMRYGHYRNEMTVDAAKRLTSVDQSRDPALALFTTGRHPEIRAIGRYYLDDAGTSGEAAFVVHEKARRNGLAGFLLGELAVLASERGLRELWGTVLPDNHGMAALFLAAGGTETTSPIDEEKVFHLPLDRVLRWRKRFLTAKKIHPVTP
jgi:RimJ/RimL family protein N-acetyltransferase